MRRSFWVCAATTLALALAAPGWANRRPKARKRTADRVPTIAPSSNVKKGVPATIATSTVISAVPEEPSTTDSEFVNPQWIPMATTSGGLGLFTIDSGDTLVKNGFAFEAGVNKFSRDPGSITVFTLGWSFSYGLSDRLTAFFEMDGHRHVHGDNPAELSLDSGTGAQFGNTIYFAIVPSGLPAYVEDYPFAYTNNGGIGDMDLGLKFGILSERRGYPFSLAVRSDVFLPTKASINDLLVNQAQSGAPDVQLALNLSKTLLHHGLMATADLGYRATHDPAVKFNNSPALTRADQIHAGAGFLVFPEKHFQLMSEYTGTVFVGNHTPDTSSAARDPLDGVWGVRSYLARFFAVDIGYRRMLNLHHLHDPNGFVAKVGVVYWPPKIILPPNVSVQCVVRPNLVTAGSGDKVNISALAVDSQNWPLTYAWTTKGGSLIGSGANVRWDSTGVPPGTYRIDVVAEDGHGGSDTCSAQVTVQPTPAPPPTMACSVDRASVLAGEKVNVTARVNDQSATPLTYLWFANGGQILGKGSAVQLDTTGLSPGTYTVTGRVQNGKGGAADCHASVAIEAPLPPAQASRISQCYFRMGSARVDNVCKRILDDVAVRLQSDPKAKVVILGYANPRKGSAQRLADKLAMSRAESSKKYLSTIKGVDESRIETRLGGWAASSRKENRRIDVLWVPERAKY